MSQDRDEGTVDLDNYSVEYSCYWLLDRLDIDKYITTDYGMPFSTYVLTWPRAVPLNAIVMAQSPYPNNIFSPISAAMSYDEDLCKSCDRIRGNIPPTVEILANDLYINAGMKKEHTVELIKNGWALVEGGMLLINESVFNNYSTPQGYKESVDQCHVIVRLLRETEKYGKRTVNIYAFGESGQRMASNLCSWYKSSIVTLSKHAVTHPAAVSRRFTDFSDSKCHMNVPSFSKSFAKCLSNYVALLHTMAKKSNEQDLRLQRQADIFKGLHTNLVAYEKETQVLVDSFKQLQDMGGIGNKDLDLVIDRIIHAGQEFATRTRITSSLMANMRGVVTDSIAGQVSKPGPSLQAVNPSNQSTTNTAVSATTESTMSYMSKPVSFRVKSKPKQVTEDSSYDKISPAPSIVSVSSSVMSTPVKFRNKRTTPAMSTASTQDKSISETPDSTKSIEDKNRSTTPTPTSASFRKQHLTETSAKSNKSGKTESVHQSLTKKQIEQLSCIAAVVEINKPGADEDDECLDYFDTIQHDIQQKIKLNNIVHDLCDCIDQDMKNIPNFDFSDWSSPQDIESKTFDKCKEIFEF